MLVKITRKLKVFRLFPINFGGNGQMGGKSKTHLQIFIIFFSFLYFLFVFLQFFNRLATWDATGSNTTICTTHKWINCLTGFCSFTWIIYLCSVCGISKKWMPVFETISSILMRVITLNKAPGSNGGFLLEG